MHTFHPIHACMQPTRVHGRTHAYAYFMHMHTATQAEKILKLAELNRKMETEQEKVVPFRVSNVAEEGKVPTELQRPKPSQP